MTADCMYLIAGSLLNLPPTPPLDDAQQGRLWRGARMAGGAVGVAVTLPEQPAELKDWRAASVARGDEGEPQPVRAVGEAKGRHQREAATSASPRRRARTRWPARAQRGGRRGSAGWSSRERRLIEGRQGARARPAACPRAQGARRGLRHEDERWPREDKGASTRELAVSVRPPRSEAARLELRPCRSAST